MPRSPPAIESRRSTLKRSGWPFGTDHATGDADISRVDAFALRSAILMVREYILKTGEVSLTVDPQSQPKCTRSTDVAGRSMFPQSSAARGETILWSCASDMSCSDRLPLIIPLDQSIISLQDRNLKRVTVSKQGLKIQKLMGRSERSVETNIVPTTQLDGLLRIIGTIQQSKASPVMRARYKLPNWYPSEVELAANCFLRTEAPRGGDGWDEGGIWTDPEGDVALSNAQNCKIHSWRRMGLEPGPITSRDLLFPAAPCPEDIVQGFVGNCSFLSTMAVMALWEARFNLPLLSSKIFPQVENAAAAAPPNLRTPSTFISAAELEAQLVLDAAPSLPPSGISIVPTYQTSCTRLAVRNPKGMYAVKSYVNGRWCKILVDSNFPTKQNGAIATARNARESEIWVSLFEKAFIKLMGGSLFMQGSNPGADGHHLTGWICETKSFRADIYNGGPSNKPNVVSGEGRPSAGEASQYWNRVWNRMIRAYLAGRLTICVGTSDLVDAVSNHADHPEGVSISSGIVARHAYAVIDIVELVKGSGGQWDISSEKVKNQRHRAAGRSVSKDLLSAATRSTAPILFNELCDGDFMQSVGTSLTSGRKHLRLLKMKNSWGQCRWKGRWSHLDNTSWTSGLQALLGYNRKSACAVDDGTFWISWGDVIVWFSHLYLSWAPGSLFRLCKTVEVRHQEPIAFRFLNYCDHGPEVQRVVLEPQFALEILPDLPESGNERREYLKRLGLRGVASDVIEVNVVLIRHVRERHGDCSGRYIAMHVQNSPNKRPELVTSGGEVTRPGVYANGETAFLRLLVLPFATEREAEDMNLSNRRNLGLKSDSSSIDDDLFLYGQSFTIIVSQYNCQRDIQFSIKALCNVNIGFSQLEPFYDESKDLLVHHKAEWKNGTAGGSSNDLWSYFRNPQFLLRSPETLPVRVMLDCPNHNCNLRLFSEGRAGARKLRLSSGVDCLSTGLYVVGPVELICQGGKEWTIIPSSFQRDVVADFTIVVVVKGGLDVERRTGNKVVILPLPSPFSDPMRLPTGILQRLVGERCNSPRRIIVLEAIEKEVQVSISARGPPGMVANVTCYRFGKCLRPEEKPPAQSWSAWFKGNKGESITKSQLKLERLSDLTGGLSGLGLDKRRSSAAMDHIERSGSSTVSRLDLPANGALLLSVELVPLDLLEAIMNEEGRIEEILWDADVNGRRTRHQGEWEVHVLSNGEIGSAQLLERGI